jgi:DNA polymerase epsilon subunit 3
MPRKSDASRRSDVSMAKFALVEGEPTDSEAPAAPPATAAATTPQASAPTASIEVDAERGSESLPPGEKRDGRDSMTIEVRTLYTQKTGCAATGEGKQGKRR